MEANPCWPPRSLCDLDDEQTQVIEQSWYLIAAIIALGAGDQIFPTLFELFGRTVSNSPDLERIT